MKTTLQSEKSIIRNIMKVAKTLKNQNKEYSKANRMKIDAKRK